MAEVAPLHFVSGDRALSQEAQDSWSPMKKKPGTIVFMKRIGQPFTVDTEEGKMAGGEDDYLAHDPVSGHFWPVKADYAAMHYEDASEKDNTDEVNQDYAAKEGPQQGKSLISHIYENREVHLEGTKEIVAAQVGALLSEYFEIVGEEGFANVKLTLFHNRVIEA